MKKILQTAMAALIGVTVLAAPAMAGGWGYKGGGHSYGHGWGHKWGGYGWGHKGGHGWGYRHYGYYDKCWKWVKYYYGWKKVYVCGHYDY